VRDEEERNVLTMMERRVSRETLNGMFLMTMAVGMISSSTEYAGRAGIGGEPADESSSEDSGELSSHCWGVSAGCPGERETRTEGRAARARE